MINSDQIRKFASCCCDICVKKTGTAVNEVIIICKQEHIICRDCFKRAKQAFTCSACQQTCNKKSSLRCKWRLPLAALYNACQIETQKVSLIGPSLVEKIGRLKAMQQHMVHLQERQRVLLQKLATTNDLIEPIPSQYQHTHNKIIEETQNQSTDYALAWTKKVTSDYRQQTDKRYGQIMLIAASLQGQGRELSQGLQNIKQANKELIIDNTRYDRYFSTKGEQWTNYREDEFQ